MATSTFGIPVPLKDVSCQELLSQADVVHHGVIRQRRTLNTWFEGIVHSGQILKWCRVYAILHKGCLYLFKDETSQRTKFATSLYGFSQVDSCSPDEVPAGVSWPFKLISEMDYRNCVIYFSSPSQTCTEKWIQCLNEQMAFANPTASQQSSVLPEKQSADDDNNNASPKLPATFHQLPHLPVLSRRSVVGPPPHTAVVAPTRQHATMEQRNPHLKARPRLPPPIRNDLQIETEDSDDDTDDIYDEPIYPETKFSKGSRFISDLKRGIASVSVSRNKSAAASDNEKKVSRPPAVAGGNRKKNTKEEMTKLTEDEHEQSTSQPSVAAPISPAPRDAALPSKPPKRAVPSPPSEVSSSVPSPTAAKPTRAVKPIPGVKPSSFKFPKPAQQPDNQCLYDDIKALSEDDYNRELLDSAFWTKSTQEAEDLMKALDYEGAFMIRESANNSGNMTLMVRIEDTVRKFKLQKDSESGEYFIDIRGPRFMNESQLLVHYMENSLPNRTSKLTSPYSVAMATISPGAMT